MKIFLDMVGCRLNQAEIESMANRLSLHGEEIVAEASLADIIIVNTCCVTAKAAADSRKMIRHLVKNSPGQVVVTGCWGTLFSDEALSLESVLNVVRNDDKETLVENLLGLPADALKDRSYVRQALPGGRQRTRAFIKVQDGCNNHCTYCLTRIARGESHSVPAHEIIRDIRAAIDGGAREVVLTGVQLGYWGKDVSEDMTIGTLMEMILRDTSIERLRLSSIEPWDINPSFFSLWKDQRLCRHLHIPLQSGSESVLRRMARKVTPEKFRRLIEAAQAEIHGIAITTDMIVGFPGESNEDFEESIKYVEGLKLAGGHVFTYSAMPGTPAAAFPDQVPNILRKERNQRMREVLFTSNLDFRKSLIGRKAEVLWEKSVNNGGGFLLSGLTETYMRVESKAVQDLRNCISSVLITGLNDKNGLLTGEIIARH
jgi:threonylcarbamoyladenosine tRNA methylthiotransferase MtaB